MTSAVVIVGAGHGGAALAALLRQSGFAGPVVVVGAEEHRPYHRPPLSKKFSGPEVEQWIRPAEFYVENDIELRTATTVVAIDRPAMQVYLSDGASIAYSSLVLATGSTPRPLPVPGGDAESVLTLRTLDDARLLGDAINRRDRLAIIGGGYVGMEVAAVARSCDLPVTIIEREERVLARVASPELSQRLTEYHDIRGTVIRVSADVTRLRTKSGRVTGIELGDGSIVEADTVLVGIGATPNDQLAQTAGLACNTGILVDSGGRTSDPSIFAIGDVSRRPVARADGLIRLESIPNATDQARQVSAAILGTTPPEPEVPWFWSDQFDIKVKIAGLISPGSRVVARAGKKPGSFAFFHLTDGDTVCAVETANAPGDFIAGKGFIAKQSQVDVEKLGDPSVSLHHVLAQPPVSV